MRWWTAAPEGRVSPPPSSADPLSLPLLPPTPEKGGAVCGGECRPVCCYPVRVRSLLRVCAWGGGGARGDSSPPSSLPLCSPSLSLLTSLWADSRLCYANVEGVCECV